MQVTSSHIDRGLAAFLNAVYPSQCPQCKGLSNSFSLSPLCRACWESVEPLGGPICRICSEPLGSEHAGDCGRCIKDTPPFERVVSFGLYERPLRKAVHLLKFSGARRLVRPLGALLVQAGLPRVDSIVPVPLTVSGLRQRGYNQTALLGMELKRRLGVPLMLDALKKVKDTPPQMGLSASERLKNLRGAFRANGALKGKKQCCYWTTS